MMILGIAASVQRFSAIEESRERQAEWLVPDLLTRGNSSNQASLADRFDCSTFSWADQLVKRLPGGCPYKAWKADTLEFQARQNPALKWQAGSFDISNSW